MEDKQLIDRINELAHEEHQLFGKESQGKASDADRQRLVALGCLHDLGKINVGFQNRASSGPGPRAGHIGPLRTLI